MGERLRGKVAVITGGSSGIGEATAELFVDEGAAVVLTGRSVERGEAVAKRLGDSAIFVMADVMFESDIKRAIDTAVDAFGGLDILFNNAGGPTDGPLTSVTEEAIQYAMRLLFASVVLGIKHAVPHLERRGGGSIINNSSIAAIRDHQGDLLYSAAKAAVTHYTRLAGTRLGPKGIRVNCISRGAVATPIFWRYVSPEQPSRPEETETRLRRVQDRLSRHVPLPRAGAAIDVAMGALYLASDEGRYVNCHDPVIEGGRTSMFHEPP